MRKLEQPPESDVTNYVSQTPDDTIHTVDSDPPQDQSPESNETNTDQSAPQKVAVLGIFLFLTTVIFIGLTVIISQPNSYNSTLSFVGELSNIFSAALFFIFSAPVMMFLYIAHIRHIIGSQ